MMMTEMYYARDDSLCGDDANWLLLGRCSIIMIAIIIIVNSDRGVVRGSRGHNIIMYSSLPNECGGERIRYGRPQA